jgi:hypothetical protein
VPSILIITSHRLTPPPALPVLQVLPLEELPVLFVQVSLALPPVLPMLPELPLEELPVLPVLLPLHQERSAQSVRFELTAQHR